MFKGWKQDLRSKTSSTHKDSIFFIPIMYGPSAFNIYSMSVHSFNSNDFPSEASFIKSLYFQYAPFKPGHKGTLAERAKALGLEPLASDYLNSPQHVDPKKYIDHSVKGKDGNSSLKKFSLYLV